MTSASEKPPVHFLIVTENKDLVIFGRNRTIRGQVLLELAEPRKARGLNLCFEGKVKTSFFTTRITQIHPAFYTEESMIDGRDRELFKKTAALWSPKEGEEEGFIPAGRHVFPFCFDFPDDETLPPNLSSEKGSISYAIEATIERPWDTNDKCSAPISYIPVYDFNDQFSAKAIEEQQEELQCCLSFFPTGSIIISARIPSNAWCPGEVIPVLVRVQNQSFSHTKDVSCYILGDVTFDSYLDLGYCTKTFSKQNLGHEVPPKSEIKKLFLLRVPPCPPSFSAKDLWLDYKVQATVLFSDKFSYLGVRIPIRIGTIPHKSPPVLPEQAINQSQIPVYNWANPEDVTRMAADVIESRKVSMTRSFDELVKEAAPPRRVHVYYEMPCPAVPAALSVNPQETTTSSGRECSRNGDSLSKPILRENLSAHLSDETSTTTTTTVSTDGAPSSFLVYADKMEEF